MTPLKTGAIALTLIIIIPIMLGYAMATEDVEETVEISENAGNITDLTLNSTTPYYIPYTGANNNGYLYRTSDDYTGLMNPDYVSTSSTTYSFTPIYYSEYESYSLESAETVTYTTGNYSFVGIYPGDSTVQQFPSFLTAKVTAGNNMGISVHITEVGWTAYSLSSGDSVFITPVAGSSDYYWLSGVSEDLAGSGYYVDVIRFPLGTVTLEYVDTYTDFDVSVDPWTVSIYDGVLALNLTYDDETTGEYFSVLADGLLYYNGSLTVTNDGNNTVYDDVASVSLALSPDVSTLVYGTGGDQVQYYADVSSGWRIPSYSGTYTDYWQNGYDNYSIRMMLHIEAGESFGIYGYSTAYLSVDSDSNGLVTVTFDGETETLGAYTDVMLDIGVRDAVTKYGTVVVSGLAEWPTFGENPDTVYNSVTLESSNYFTGPFEQLKIAGSNTVEIRVDSANIIGGYFPSTNGYFYWPYSLFPDDSLQGIVIDSVGIYGDMINVGGVWCPVTSDNKITVRDADTGNLVDVPVLGMVIEFEENDDGDAWITYVDGYRISNHVTAPSVGFGGEWSFTLHRTVTTEETVTSTQWQAGEFAFTQDDFILCMILSTVLVFVGLGLMRGVKIGVLAVVCSAAGIIAFMIA